MYLYQKKVLLVLFYFVMHTLKLKTFVMDFFCLFFLQREMLNLTKDIIARASRTVWYNNLSVLFLFSYYTCSIVVFLSCFIYVFFCHKPTTASPFIATSMSYWWEETWCVWEVENISHHLRVILNGSSIKGLKSNTNSGSIIKNTIGK